MYNFTTQFRNDVDRVAKELGLINSTSERQVKNGTIELTDPVASRTNCRVTYTLHENGYIRRRNYIGGTRHVAGFYFPSNQTAAYPLNPRLGGHGRFKHGIVRSNPIEQLGILTSRVLKYREYLQTESALLG